MAIATSLASLLEKGQDLEAPDRLRVAALLKAGDQLASCMRNLRDVGRIDDPSYAVDRLGAWDLLDSWDALAGLPAAPQAVMEHVAEILRSFRFQRGREVELQEAIAGVLEGRVAFRREEALSGRDRVDFYLPHGAVAIEVKITGSPPVVLSQLLRYADHAAVRGILLVTTRSKHRQLPDRVRGKPLEVIYLCPL